MKKILLQFSMSPSRLNDIITACHFNNVSYDFFSYYSNSNQIDEIPENILDGNHFTFSSIPPIYNSLKRDSIHYKYIDDFKKFNEAFIDSYFGNSFNNFEQEYIFNGMLDGTIPKIPMLNEGSKIIPLSGISKSHIFTEEIFIKPNSSFKEFIGGVTIIGETFEYFLHRKKLSPTQNIDIMVSPYRSIHSEYRFLVYDGKVIEGSSYIVDGKLTKNALIPDIIKTESHRLARLYQPGKAFTLDLCLLTDGDVKIVEYNHLSASGHYNCTLNDLINVIASDEKPSFSI